MSGCLLWTGSRQNGYGVLRVDGRMWYAHRYAWTIARGPIPPGLCVLHRCDVPLCVRLGHLWLGTQSENSKDMWQKGREGSRFPPGTRNPIAKLSARKVQRIRRLAADGVTQRHLAAGFGVSQPAISHIVRRKNWRHVASGNFK